MRRGGLGFRLIVDEKLPTLSLLNRAEGNSSAALSADVSMMGDCAKF